MKNSKNNKHLNPTLVKSLALGVIVCSSTLGLIGLDLLPLSPTIEILASMIAIVVAMTSLRYVYLEHKAMISEENKLREDLIHQICACYPIVGPNQKRVRNGIIDVLNTQPNHLLRIQALEYYKKDRLALDQFLKTLSTEGQRSSDPL